VFAGEEFHAYRYQTFKFEGLVRRKVSINRITYVMQCTDHAIAMLFNACERVPDSFFKEWGRPLRNPMKSFYETLEVSPNASNYVIRAAYRCLAQHDHPDKNPDSISAGRNMTNINRAYAVLSDQERRKEYDLCQRISKESLERHSFHSVLPAQGQSHGNKPPSDRPFVFQPFV
jgi:preprotein translocase subunit Sec63